ncbi:MAG: glycosyltransferase family 87 protein, partial [Chloroflexota bacterium]
MKLNSQLSTPNLKLTHWLILIALLGIVIAGESFALYTIFTSKFPGGNDFFVRWLGGRELIRHGTNPYDRSIAEQAQQAMFGRLTRPEDKDQAYFAYPLYTLYFFWPLSLLPYAWAQAVWMTLLQFMLLGSTILAVRLSGWSPPGWLFWMTVLWGILFYNGARAIILGQFSILVGLALFLALWAIEQRRDGWGGVFLAVTTIKPQMVFLALVFLLLWALFQRRRRIVVSFVVSLLALTGTSMLLAPTWPLDFARNAVAYSDYVAFGTPLENLLHYVLPPTLAAPLTPILSAVFFLALLPGWWLAWRTPPLYPPPVTGGEQGGGYTWAVMTTLIVGSLITFRSATTNQVILYLPLFFF